MGQAEIPRKVLGFLLENTNTGSYYTTGKILRSTGIDKSQQANIKCYLERLLDMGIVVSSECISKRKGFDAYRLDMREELNKYLKELFDVVVRVPGMISARHKTLYTDLDLEITNLKSELEATKNLVRYHKSIWRRIFTKKPKDVVRC